MENVTSDYVSPAEILSKVFDQFHVGVVGESEKKFLHLLEKQEEWIKERLENCPLTNLQCRLEG